MKMRFFLILLTFVTISASAAQIVPTPKTSTPKIDGKLDDACWKQAQWQNSFTVLDKPKVKASPQTRFKVVHDNSFLYIAVELDEPTMNKLKAKITMRDGRVWVDDCLEIFIDANRDKASYHHFVINSTGTVYDSERRQGGHVGTSKWNSAGIKTATSKQNNSWTLEVAIPFVDLGISGNTTWGINIARERQAGGKLQLSTFVPLTGGFHEPANFASLQLRNADLSSFSWKIKPPYALRTVMENGKKLLAGKTFITNNTGKFRFVKLSSSLSGGGKQLQTFALDKGLGKEYSIKIPAGKNGATMLNLSLIDRRTGKSMALLQFPETVSYNPLAIILTQPFYRNCIFSDQKISTLKGSVVSGLSPDVLKKSKLTISLHNATGKTLAQKKIAEAMAKMEFALSIPQLPYGKYILKATITGRNKYQTSISIKKLVPRKGQVRIDSNLTTYVDGKKFFPYGWFSINQKHWKRAAKSGCNVLIDYNAYYKTDAQLKKWLDDIQSVGLKAIIYPYPKRSYNNNEPWGKPLSETEADGIRGFVRKWKNHPALLGWYMGDEPELRPALPARMTAIYNTCRDEDPYHPCILLNDTMDGIRKYIDGGDVFNPDPYPLFLRGGNAARPIGKVGKFIDTVLETGKKRKAAWITPQAFNYGDYGAVNNRAPNFLELRNMQYQAIIAGVQGFTWYTWYAALQYPEITLSMEYLTKEAVMLKDIIMSPQNRVVLKTEDKFVKAVMYRKVNGHNYIFAVSNATEAKTVTIKLPKNSPDKWYIIGENRSIKTLGGTIKEKFGKYDVNLYTTNAKLAASLSLKKAEKRVADGIKALRRPGNLAFKGNSVKITFSTKKGRWDNTHIIDGAREGRGWIDTTLRKFPDWATVDFNKSVVVARAELFCENITDAELQIKKNGRWKTVAKFKRVSPLQMTAKFASVKTTAVRLLIKGSSDGRTMINELEIYSK
jgi:Carbohydrate family 9 binding domain-like